MDEARPMRTTQTVQERLLATIEVGDLATAESLWLELAADPPLDTSFYEQFIRAMRRAKALEMAHDWLLLAVEELEGRDVWPTILEILRTASRFWPDSKPLRPHVARALKRVYRDVNALPDMIAACKGLSLDRVFARMDELLRMVPGEVYSHPYWGDGIVCELDIPGNRVVLEFPDAEPSRRELTLEFLLKHLVHRPAGSFTARLMHELPALKDWAEEQPVEFVKLVLAERGGRLKQSEFKELVLDRVFSDSEWQRWWAKARTALRLDPWIDFDGNRGARAEIVLRSQPRSVEEEVLTSYFDPDAGLEQRMGAVRELLRAAADGAAISEKAPRELAVDLARRAASAPEPADRLASRYALESLAEVFPAVASALVTAPQEAMILAELTDYGVLSGLPDVAQAQRGLRWLLARDGEPGADRAAAVLPRASVSLAQAVWTELEARGLRALAVRAVRSVLERPLENPETFLWAARNITERRWKHLDDDLPLGPFVFELLEWLNEWQAMAGRPGVAPEDAQRAKWLLGRVRSLVSAGEFEVLGHAAKDMPLEQVQDLVRVIELHNVFNEAARQQALRRIHLARRDLTAASSPKRAPSPAADAGVHWCTAKGLARAAAELHELNTVTIPENAKEIEKARSEGDLRENAGYHGARERHAHLLRRAHFLQDGIARARVVSANEVQTDAVNFGTTVTLRNLDSGQLERYTLLGIWEADPDRSIYFYKAPFPQQFIGKRVGEEFSANRGDGLSVRYRVEAIENALASGEWDEQPAE